ncbi:MAG TPA: alpha/beta fold hydrolase [Acidisarcina sp.]
MTRKRELLDPAPYELPLVRGGLHRPTNPNGDNLILTHGAGTNSDAPLLVALAEAFCAAGITVLRYDLPFRQLRPHGPPPRGSAERDQQGLRAAVTSMRQQTTGRVFLGGHSYGGRQASILAAAEPSLIEALLLLSYPLHPPQRPNELRTAHFPNLKTPTLFVHGTRDGFATIEELSAALKLIPAPTKLLPILSAGHELMTKKNRAELSKSVVETLRSFTNQAVP